MAHSHHEEEMMTQTHSMDRQMQDASGPLRVEEHITVKAPAWRVYEVWRDFTRF